MDDLIRRQDAFEVLNKLARDNFTLKDGFSFYMGALQDVSDGIEALPSAQPAKDINAPGEDAIDRPTGWISVTERLPEDGVAVNVVWSNHSPVIYYQHIRDKPQTATGVYYRGQWYWWSAVVQDYLEVYGEWEPDKMDTAIEVTHWMPLPEPYKDGGGA